MRQKRILMYRWKAYNYLDIMEHFKMLGYDVDEVYQHLESYDVDDAYAETFAGYLREKDYDFVFTVNYFALISDVCEREGTLYVSWSCDNPLISMYHKSVFHSCNRIFTFDRTNYEEFRAMGVEHIYYLPLCVDAGRMDSMIRAARDLPSYENEIAFVGSLYERNSYDRIEPELSEYERGYFTALMEAQSDLYGTNLVDRLLTPEILEGLQSKFRLEKSEDSFSDLSLIFSTTTLGFKIAEIQRRRGLLELGKRHNVSIYSNSDTNSLLNVNYRGSVEYWTEMPKVFYGSRINLNFTIPNIPSGIPLRMWDVLGAGGFLLSNFQPEAPLYFKDGVDMVSFHCQEELLDKTAYYLAHEEERARIARAGHDTVLTYHTYETRMEEILRVLDETT